MIATLEELNEVTWVIEALNELPLKNIFLEDIAVTDSNGDFMGKIRCHDGFVFNTNE